MKIRKATLKDFEALKRLKTEFFLWECDTDVRLDPCWAERSLGARLAKDLRSEDTAFFIAILDGDMVGYAGAEIKKNLRFVKARWHGHLFNLYVRPKYQNRGVGSRLLREALAWFKNNKVTDLQIMVYEQNIEAKKLYLRHGFSEYIQLLKK